jgi:hypothetical protein
MLKIITKRVAIEFPKAPLFTIHDSVATTEDYKEAVLKIMDDELTELTGFPPKLKVDYWGAENIDWNKYKI